MTIKQSSCPDNVPVIEWNTCTCGCGGFRPAVTFPYDIIFNYTLFRVSNAGVTELVLYRGHGQRSLSACVGYVSTVAQASEILNTLETETLSQLRAGINQFMSICTELYDQLRKAS
jgi:hypothetical protein